MLVVYAILVPPARPTRRRGASGEAIAILRCRGVHVAAGSISAAPAVSAAALRAHDAVIRRLASDVPAILPARFGSVVADEHELGARLAPIAPALRKALVEVRGREQMTLRLFGQTGRSARRSRVTQPPASGTAYLERARVAEVDPLRKAVARLVRGERVVRASTPPLVATVYHLIDRGRARAYAAAVRRAAASAGLRVRATGPFPPYAFAPEVAA